jgi:hypothetical protein
MKQELSPEEEIKDSAIDELTQLLFSSDYDLHYNSLKSLKAEDFELYQVFFAQSNAFASKRLWKIW